MEIDLRGLPFDVAWHMFRLLPRTEAATVLVESVVTEPGETITARWNAPGQAGALVKALKRARPRDPLGCLRELRGGA